MAKRLLPAAVLGLFVAAGGFTAATKANSPVFNDLPNDYPTLQVRKTGTSAWGTTANVQPGDYVDMLVWVHNTRPGTTAQNTRANVTLPQTSGTNHQVAGKVWATNANAVTGLASVLSNQESSLSYVADSAKLLKSVNGSMQVVNWPNGVNGNDVVTPNGVSLGNIEGCWQYAQAVLLMVKVEGANPAINTNKKVALTGGDTFADTANAQPGDAVQYKIFLENTGNGTGRNPKIVDTLDAKTKYIAGSSKKRIKVNNNDVDVPINDSDIQIENLSDGRQRLTYSFPDMAPQPNAALYLMFQVRLVDASHFSVGTTHIDNIATASFTGVAKDTNMTRVTVVKNPDPVVTFTLNKQVANVTKGETTWKGDLTGSGAPGDVIAFRLIMTNTGNTAAANVSLKDILPAGMTYVNGTAKLYNTGNQNGVAIDGNALLGNGYVFSEVKPGTINQQIVIFHAKLADHCSTTQTLINKAQVIWQGQVRAEDTAGVIVTCNPGLYIQKDVRVPGSNQFVDNGGIVRESDILTYRIIVTNTGNTTAVNPVLRDVLPANVTYVNNSLRIDGEVMSATVQNQFFNQGMTLTNFTPGMTKYITFDVKIDDCPVLGDHVLVNNAFVKANGIAEISDSARVTLRVTVPTL